MEGGFHEKNYKGSQPGDRGGSVLRDVCADYGDFFAGAVPVCAENTDFMVRGGGKNQLCVDDTFGVSFGSERGICPKGQRII